MPGHTTARPGGSGGPLVKPRLSETVSGCQIAVVQELAS